MAAAALRFNATGAKRTELGKQTCAWSSAKGTAETGIARLAMTVWLNESTAGELGERRRGAGFSKRTLFASMAYAVGVLIGVSA